MKRQVFALKFSAVYPLFVKKAERKGRTKGEVDQLICWLTGDELAKGKAIGKIMR